MGIYIYIHIYNTTYIYIYIFIHIYTPVYLTYIPVTNTHTYMYIYIYIYLCMYVTYIYIYIDRDAHICIYIYIYKYLCVCGYAYKLIPWQDSMRFDSQGHTGSPWFVLMEQPLSQLMRGHRNHPGAAVDKGFFNTKTHEHSKLSTAMTQEPIHWSYWVPFLRAFF